MENVAGANFYKGDDNDETIIASNKSTLILGGTGNDTSIGGSGNDYFIDIEGNNNFFGNGGKDTLAAGDGDDLLNGGKGSDTLFGGGGKDIFKYDSLNDSKYSQLNASELTSDYIGDFTQGQDKIDLSGLGFQNITKDTSNLPAEDSDTLDYYYDQQYGVTVIENQDNSFQIRVAGQVDFNNGDFIF